MNKDKWILLGKDVKLLHKLLSEIMAKSNELEFDTYEMKNILSMKQKLIKFKSNAERKMFSEGIINKNIFYGEINEFDPLICECGEDIEFCGCFNESEDEE